VCEKTAYNSPEVNQIELIYITTRHNVLDVSHREDYTSIYYDMLNLTSSDANLRKITVYTEDKEARWFLQKLIQPILDKVSLSTVCLGSNELLRLYKDDPRQFRNCVFVLDGDTRPNEIEETKRRLPPEVKNIIKLPTEGNSPEEVFYQFLERVLPDTDYKEAREEICAAGDGFSYRTIIRENGPASDTGNNAERDKNKRWFNRYKPAMDAAYPHWERLHKDIVNAFRSEFVTAYNYSAKKYKLPSINSIPLID
jgi:hypothetical protein